MAKPRRRVQFLMETSLGRGTVGFAQKPQFLHFRREETDVSDFEDKIPQAVVPRNPIPGLAAAYGVIPVNIHGLLAKRTRSRVRVHGLAEETGNCSAID